MGRRAKEPRCAAFTLLELLVTIAIIAILAGILIPVVMHTSQTSRRIRVGGDLQAISTALEAYKADFGDYPRLIAPTGPPVTGPNGLFPPQPPAGSPNQVYGAQLLCWALIAPGPATGVGSDGANGPGFRTRPGMGKVCGPYLQPEKFQLSQSSNKVPPGSQFPQPANSTYPADNSSVILDIYGHPILYFAALPGNPSIYAGNTAGTTFLTNVPWSSTSLFNTTDNPDGNAVNPPAALGWSQNVKPSWAQGSLSQLQQMALMLGVRDTTTLNNATGNATSIAVTPGHDQPVSTGPYLLWSSGADGIFGVIQSSSGTLSTDNVTNFDIDTNTITIK